MKKQEQDKIKNIDDLKQWIKEHCDYEKRSRIIDAESCTEISQKLIDFQFQERGKELQAHFQDIDDEKIDAKNMYHILSAVGFSQKETKTLMKKMGYSYDPKGDLPPPPPPPPRSIEDIQKEIVKTLYAKSAQPAEFCRYCGSKTGIAQFCYKCGKKNNQ